MAEREPKWLEQLAEYMNFVAAPCTSMSRPTLVRHAQQAKAHADYIEAQTSEIEGLKRAAYERKKDTRADIARIKQQSAKIHTLEAKLATLREDKARLMCGPLIDRLASGPVTPLDDLIDPADV